MPRVFSLGSFAGKNTRECREAENAETPLGGCTCSCGYDQGSDAYEWSRCTEGVRQGNDSERIVAKGMVVSGRYPNNDCHQDVTPTGTHKVPHLRVVNGGGLDQGQTPPGHNILRWVSR